MAPIPYDPFVEKLIKICSMYLKDQVRWQKGMKKELEKLRDLLPKIQAVVSDSGQIEIEDQALKKWSWQLRDAIYEADDLLDEFEYEKLEKQARKSKKVRKVCYIDLESKKKRIVKIAKRAARKDSKLKRLEKVVRKLDEVSNEVTPFLHLIEKAKKEQRQQEVELHKTRKMGSMPANVLLGRSEEKEFVMNWLRNPNQTKITNTTDSNRKFSLLSVVGHGGMGKTTLLQHVYNDRMTWKFDVKMWASVSTNFDAETVIKSSLESLKNEKIILDALEPLQRTLQFEVNNKMFLLVLDDIWEEVDEKNCEKWEKVLAPLEYGKPGSKILITTRVQSVATTFANMIKDDKKILVLKGLEDGQCLKLFIEHALDGVDENSNIHKRLSSIAKEKIKQLSGCPLAAKLIGGILKSNLDESYWKNVLSNIGNIGSGQNHLLIILKLTFIRLPKFLQICFAFCCIFEQDYSFDKADLVRMWIALDFIPSSNISEETLEDIGRRYFDVLVKNCFFEKFSDEDGVFYKVPHLVYELTRSISAHEFLRVTVDTELPIPSKNILHLSVNIRTTLEAPFEKMAKFRNLRSLFLSYNGQYDENFVKLLDKIFKASTNIRLLVISAPFQKEISKMIGCLTHLRYLKFKSAVVQLPKSISQLYHLQNIICKDSDDMGDSRANHDFLPEDINNLYNLRYLKLPLNACDKIKEIGKLKSLQELDCFNVQSKIGYGIEELEHMNDLRKITIRQLENIEEATKARMARLCDKKNLTDLSLQWGDYEDRKRNKNNFYLDEEVLNNIKPHNNLKRLCINAYMGIRSPTWMCNNVSVISNLEKIELNGCLKWHTLPPFGQLTFLKSLFLRNMEDVTKLDHNKDSMFQSLEVLHIENLKALEEWFDTTVAADGKLLPCLTQLYLKNCPKLRELPSLPIKLQNLEMVDIDWQSCNLLEGIKNCSRIAIRNVANIIHLTGRQVFESNESCQLIMDSLCIKDPSVLLIEPLRSMSSLRFLEIGVNDEFISFPSEAEQWFLQHRSSLFGLEFQKLKSLESLSSLESLTSLNSLRVDNVPQLNRLPNPPASLVRLELCNLKSLKYLPSSSSTFSSLKSLQLKNIPLLRSLPDLPSLQWLVLESLQSLPCSLSTFSSLQTLKLIKISPLKSLSDLPSSLITLYLEDLESLQCQKYSLLTFTSLRYLKLKKIPLLQSLPDLPSSLEYLELEELKLPLSPLYSFSSLRHVRLRNIPFPKSFSDFPSSLEYLDLNELISEACDVVCPSLSNLSSLGTLYLKNIPILKSLSELPPSLRYLYLEELENLDSLPALPTLNILTIIKAPRLQKLPDKLPASTYLSVIDCDKLMEAYENFRSQYNFPHETIARI